MQISELSKLLANDGYIQVNKTLIKTLGLHEAILLGELCAEYNHWELEGKLEDGMFYSTRENIEENTGLTEHLQRKAITTLQEKHILRVEKKGLPAKNYYGINVECLLEWLTTSGRNYRPLVVENFNLSNNKNNNKENNLLSNDNKLDLPSTPTFEFGKQKKRRSSLFTKCVAVTDDFISQLDNPPDGLRKKLIEYLTFRIKADKPLYGETQWRGILNKLLTVDDIMGSIEQSIYRGYLSFYAVKKFNQPPWSNDDKFAERGVRSDTYTAEELEELRRIDEERERNGLRTKF